MGNTKTGIKPEDENLLQDLFKKARTHKSGQKSEQKAGEEVSPKPAASACFNRRSFGLGAGLGCLICAILMLATSYYFTKSFDFGISQQKYINEMYAEYGKYYELEKLIKDNAFYSFTEDIIDDDGTCRRILSGLKDEYATYFNKEEYQEFCAMFLNPFVGIGVLIYNSGEQVLVERVVENSPAEKAGIKAEDQIISIDGKQVTDIEDASQRLGGEVGTLVKVEIIRDNKKLEFKISRQELEEKSVFSKELDKDNHIAYIQISTFRRDTATEFKTAVNKLKKQGYERFVIDLRENLGGLTDEAIDCADYLLPECNITKMTTANGKAQMFKSKASNAKINYVILIDQNTASASEIMASAIQDNDGGKLIGTKTYGKGVFQATHEFKDGTAVKFTIGEYTTPDGNKVQGIGLTPDIESHAPLESAITVLSDK